MNNKRGLSTIIVTLILIVVSLVAVAIFWVVVRNLLQTGTEGIGLGRYTLSANIKNVNLDNSTNNVSLTVERNPGQGEINGIEFIFSDGTESEVVKETISMKELESRKFYFHLTKLNVSKLISISIAFLIKQDNTETLGDVVDKYNVGEGGGGGSTGGGTCSPATCTSLGYSCGTWNNGTCSGTLNCGTCSGELICNANGICASSCTPTTCLALGFNCGTPANGTCSGTLNCGTCGNGYDCVGGNCVASGGYTCGNNILEPGEACDGTDMGGYACTTIAGFASGTLSCSSDCKRYITTSCVAGNTVTALSCSQTDVQNAINSATSGDTVVMPAGNCTWTGTITLSEGILLKGAGIDNTIILYTGTTNAIISTDRCRITSLTLESSSASDLIRQSGQYWRIDHIKFIDLGSVGTAVYSIQQNEAGKPWPGLIDNCEITNCRILVIGNSGFYRMSTIWNEPLGLGTNDAVYVENCTITKDSGNAIDANRAGKYVIRYCTLNDGYIEAHSLQADQERATRSWEIYGNIINEVNIAMWVPMFLRGGTGVVFNNIIDSGFTSDIALDNVRSFTDAGGDAKMCNGSSSWDGNTAGQQGWMCRDQIGASTDVSLWASTSPYPSQTQDPAYFWNNKDTSGNDVVPFIHNGCGNWIQVNRDYYTGTAKPGYVPYPYPHPLTLVS
jgi:hypothetical protein